MGGLGGGQGFGLPDLGSRIAEYRKGIIIKMKRYKVIVGIVGLVSLLACAGNQTGDPATGADAVLITPGHLKDIVGVEWYLKRMKVNNETISLITDTNITFSCDANGKVAGLASLNRYFGNFNLKEDGELIWSKAFGMTRMAGPPELMDQEAKFMQALPLTSGLYLKKEMLVVVSSDQSTVLEFEKN